MDKHVNNWKCFEALVEHCVFRYGHFSIYLLSEREYNFYKNYYMATLCMEQTMERPIHRLCSELMSQELIDVIYMRSVTPEIADIMEKYKMKELKRLVILNHYPIDKIIYKPYKKNWAKALFETKKWGFNVFAMKSMLNDDIVRHIKSFL